MIRGYPYVQHSISSSHCSTLSILTSFILNDNDNNNNIPLYICNFFKHIVKQIKMVQINVANINMDRDKAVSGDVCYGYLSVKKLFFIFSDSSNEETPNLS